jgi:hypothetical protein
MSEPGRVKLHRVSVPTPDPTGITRARSESVRRGLSLGIPSVRRLDNLRRVMPGLLYSSCVLPFCFERRNNCTLFTNGLGQSGMPGDPLNRVMTEEHTNMRVSGGQLSMRERYLANSWTVLVGMRPTDELMALLANIGLLFGTGTMQTIMGNALAGYLDFVPFGPLDFAGGMDFRIMLRTSDRPALAAFTRSRTNMVADDPLATRGDGIREAILTFAFNGQFMQAIS